MQSLIVKLKQHSPYVHFQHEQEGSTLRASEVKPKLDKFIIINKSDGESALRVTKNKWFIKSDKSSLNYKLKIVASENKHSFDKNIITTPKKLFLYEEITCIFLSFETELLSFIEKHINEFFIVNNFGFRKSKGYGSFTVQKINHNEILVSYADVRSNLKNKYTVIGAIDFDLNDNYFFEFDSSNLFSINNRLFNDNRELKQAFKNACKYVYLIDNCNIKALCFDVEKKKIIISDYVKKTTNKKNELIISFPQFKAEIHKNYDNNIENNKQLLFVTFYNYYLDTIELDNRNLKSGINTIQEYKKAELFKVFIQKGIIWEKRLLKKLINLLPPQNKFYKNLASNLPPSINNSKRDNSWDDPFNNTDYRFIRALLGLPEQYEFKTNDDNFKFITQFESASDVQRFQSPLFFKIFENYIFVCYDKSYTEILDCTFNIKFIVKEKRGIAWIERSNLSLFNGLKTPDNRQLNKVQFEKMLNEYFKDLNYE